MTELSDQFEKAILSLDRVAARKLLQNVDDSPLPWSTIETVLSTTLEKIGRSWETGTLALAQVYMCGRICEELIDTLTSGAIAVERRNQPRMAIAVLEDYHFLGKRMVYSVLRASGFELLDYGHQDADGLIRRVKEDGIEIVLISTLMLPSALRVGDVKAKLDGTTKVLVGGAPFRFDERLWKEVGADAMGQSASDAISLVKGIIGGAL